MLAAQSSLRSLARSHPLWTYVSIPSGRTSDTVTWRSTSGVEARIHALQRSGADDDHVLRSGALTYDTAVPGGFCVH